MLLTEKITDLETRLAAVTTERDGLTAKLEVAQGQAQKNFADLTAVTTERDMVAADLAKVTGERDAAKEKLGTFDADVAAKANIQLQAAMAQHGVPAIKIGDGADAPAASAKPDFSKLHGLEKSIAVAKWEQSQHTK